ncbi:MAG TPA: PAS domain S-box protein [Bryobacteraceae bacterium]|nr:PAS domain S-box protein [Bryobacteraceae bacterium]
MEPAFVSGNFTASSWIGEWTPGQQRRETRYVVDQPVLVYAAGAIESIRAAHIRDISTRGMQLLVEEPFSAGPQIRIRWNSHEVKGRILYQHKYDCEHYRIGVELSSSCETLLIEILASHAEELRRTKSLLERQTAALERTVGFLDLVSEALIVTSTEGTIVLWNKGAETIYGWTSEEALGRQWNGLVGVRARDEVASRRRKDGAVVVVASRTLTHPASPAGPGVLIFLETLAV